MPTITEVRVHGQLTTENRLQYQFTPKHHGHGGDASQWIPDLTFDAEFSVFELADVNQIRDSSGRMYGILVDGDTVRDLGTYTEQLAEFPVARAGEAWHGYPVWAVNHDDAPANRASQKARPEKAAFIRLEQVGLLSARNRKRLFKGDHI